MTNTNKTFNLNLKAATAKTGGTITKLSEVQKSFKDNAQNITLNLAKLEQAGVVDLGAALVVTTKGVYVIWPESETKLLADLGAVDTQVPIPGGDRRNTKYVIMNDTK